jgi:hypothetical protein
MAQPHEKEGGNVALAGVASTAAGLGTVAGMTHVLQKPQDIQLGLEGIGKNVPVDSIKDAKEGISNVAKNGGNFLKNNYDKFKGLDKKGQSMVLAATVAAAAITGWGVHEMTKKPSTTLDHNPEAQLAGRVQSQGQTQGRQV